MRVSFELPDGLLRQASALARKRRVPLRELVSEGLTLLVQKDEAEGYVLPDKAFCGDGLVSDLERAGWEVIRARGYEWHGG